HGREEGEAFLRVGFDKAVGFVDEEDSFLLGSFGGLKAVAEEVDEGGVRVQRVGEVELKLLGEGLSGVERIRDAKEVEEDDFGVWAAGGELSVKAFKEGGFADSAGAYQDLLSRGGEEDFPKEGYSTEEHLFFFDGARGVVRRESEEASGVEEAGEG